MGLRTELVENKRIKLDIQDTEFLLRHLIEGQYAGREIEQVSKTLDKVKQIHQRLMDLSVEV